MAVNTKKEDLIQEAQKFAGRGQFDKAAKAYEQITALEPEAISLRQKLAELLIKCGRNDDARRELETIGRHFSKNGFFLKAIAVYKQLQKIFPSDISLSRTLAELNEKHGLIANALSEYKLVYEFYEKAGNTSEALGILGRMENVDPQNIPIKIKLAEVYIQQGNRDGAYVVLTKAASSLLERGDNTTFAKVCARIQQLIPDKPDFMFEILTELINQGNAAPAIESIQSLLRSDPTNKRSWDLVVRAYQMLEEPRRLKIAYQHYLIFFPSEPAAIIGLISAVIAEQNVAEAVELLDKYEAALISAGFLHQLEQAYHALDKIDPINARVIEGLIRVATASGNDSEASALRSKLQSLRSFSGSVPVDDACLEPQPVFIDAPPLTDPLDTDADSFRQPEEELEIEIEIDLDSPFYPLEQAAETEAAQDNWLDTVDGMFDSISTAPRAVKFGNEMEESDAQSHFDLGQAFKEMGLYDEAINEFRQASQEASRRVECLIMQCACLRERGELEKAATILQALLNSGLNEEDSCAVKYELASELEAAGKMEEANILLNEICAANPGFRDIRSRLNAAGNLNSLDFSDKDLQDF